MLRTWNAIPLVVALTASVGALSGCLVEPQQAPPEKPDVTETKPETAENKVETPKGDAPELKVPPKAEVARDCAAVQPIPVEPGSIEPLKLPDGADPALTDPAKATATAPERFKVKFTTTKGDFVLDVYRPWAPVGVDRFYNLVKIGFFDGNKFFRAVDGFMIQFGVTGYPEVNAVWSQARIKDDPVKFTNKRGTVTFAKCGAPNCRSTQLFLNTSDRNTFLDRGGFAPFGVIADGMDVIDSFNTCYGDAPNPQNPADKGPNQGLIQQLGNAYLDAGWPELDGVIKAEVLPE